MGLRVQYDTKDTEHERFHGERTVEAIVAWADTLVKQVNKEIPMSRVVDYDGDGEKDSHNGVGCMVGPLVSASGLARLEQSVFACCCRRRDRQDRCWSQSVGYGHVLILYPCCFCVCVFLFLPRCAAGGWEAPRAKVAWNRGGAGSVQWSRVQLGHHGNA